MFRLISLLALLFPASTFAAVLHSCPFEDGSAGDNLNRGYYVDPYAGATLDAVTMRLRTSVDGSYDITLTARAGAYDGPVIGAAQASADLTTDLVEVTWDFKGAEVEPESLVTFALTLDDGPGSTMQVFYDTGEPAADCPDFTQTSGTDAPLSTFRRDSVGAIIEGSAEPALAYYRWKGHSVSCSADDGGSISTGTRTFEWQNLPADAQLLRQDRVTGVPGFEAGPSDAPDGSGEESFGNFVAGGLGAFPFVWESQRTTLIDDEPVYYSNLVATCYEEGPALVTLVNTPLEGEFAMNNGMTASWFDPAFNGEGFNVEVLTAPTFAAKGAPDVPGAAVVYWYTFDAAGFPVWFFGVGFWSGNTLVVPMLFDYDGTGPVFGPGFDSAEFVPTDWGTLVLVFLTCDRAFGAFAALDEVTFPSHTFDVERITNVRGISDCAF